MTEFGTVGALRRYPVKSMLGEDLAAAEVAATGIAGDRAWALVDRETGKVVSAKNPRLWRAMLTLEAAGEGTVEIGFPGGRAHRDDDAGIDEVLSEFLGRPVTLTGSPLPGAVLERSVPEDVLAGGVTAEVDFEEVVMGAGSPPGTFVDFAPLHLIGVPTLEAIGTRDGAVRYRPNLVVDTGGPAYGENEWAGREVAIGDEVVLRMLVPTPRCAVPTLEHGDLPLDPDALRVPARDNRVEPMAGFGLRACAGVYASVVRPGRIRLGDSLRFL